MQRPIIVGLFLALCIGTGLAQISPPSLPPLFTYPVPPVFPHDANETCLIGNFEDDPGPFHSWVIMNRVPGVNDAILKVIAVGVNPAESGAISVFLIDEVGPKSLVVAHPPTGENVGFLTLSLEGGKAYPVIVQRIDPGFGMPAAHHYKLGAPDRRLELGYFNIRYLEHERQAWAINADAGEEVSIEIATDPGPANAPQADTTTISIQDTLGGIVYGPVTLTPNGIVSFPSPGNGPLVVMVEQSNGHFMLRKNSGIDRGVYMLPCPNHQEPPNRPPDCSNAAPSIAEIWPPNHKMVDVTINGVVDPDGDPVTIRIMKITQDEPLDTYGDGSFEPDGAGLGTDVAQVRAERSGTKKVPGNGRVYVIHFEASDGKGGVCQGMVRTCVPHDQGKGKHCIDDGQRYNSITGAMEPPVAPGGAVATSPDRVAEIGTPGTFIVHNAFPNPFNPSTTISFELVEESFVTLKVFDALGREVALLVQGRLAGGRHAVQFNAENLPSGLYVYRLESGNQVQSRKLLLMK